jgi:hypothetical protein
MKTLQSLVTQEELRRLFELRARGIPLDEDLLQEMEEGCRGLELYQSPIILDTSVFDLPDGGAGFILGLWMHNGSNRVIRVQEYRLAIPWHPLEFHWLEKPWASRPRQDQYLFPSRQVAGFDPTVVLNHRLGRAGQLLAGDDLEGFLLGVQPESIPSEYKDRQRVQMQLSIFDQRAQPYELNMQFLVSRERQRQHNESKKRLRGANDQSNKENGRKMVPAQKV